MTDSVYQKSVRRASRRTRPHDTGICKLCGVGVTYPPAHYCPVCIDRAARIYEAYALAGEAHRFHMGRLHVGRYEWHVIEVAV